MIRNYKSNPNCLKRSDYPNWNAHSSQVMEMLGLNRKGKLPDDGMPPRVIQGITVWVNPRIIRSDGRKSSTHRVMAACPNCGRTMSAGRLHQHTCR
jgi:hypothetical protein